MYLFHYRVQLSTHGDDPRAGSPSLQKANFNCNIHVIKGLKIANLCSLYLRMKYYITFVTRTNA